MQLNEIGFEHSKMPDHVCRSAQQLALNIPFRQSPPSKWAGGKFIGPLFQEGTAHKVSWGDVKGLAFREAANKIVYF